MSKNALSPLALLLVGVGLAAAQEVSTPVPDLSTTPILPASSGAAPDAPRVWLGADYMLWRIKAAPIPVPLLTSGPFDPNLVGQPSPPVGVLGNPATTVLYGNNSVGFGSLSGLRLQGGVALNDVFAAEVGGFFLQQGTRTFTANSNASGTPLLVLPQNGPDVGGETGVAIARPDDATMLAGGFAGGVTIRNTSRLWGTDANVSALVYGGDSLKVTALAGFRYLNLYETLSIDSSSTQLDVPLVGGFQGTDVNPGDTVTTHDAFQTRNQFYGGQVGTRLEYTLGDLSVGLLGKVALGSTSQRLSIVGASSLLAQGMPPLTVPAGVFAVGSNSGVQHRSSFTVVPEVGLNVGWQVTPWLRASAGYSYLYWSSVVRPGNQLDHTVDGRQVPLLTNVTPGTTFAQPPQPFSRSDFWAQGVTLGLSVSF